VRPVRPDAGKTRFPQGGTRSPPGLRHRKGVGAAVRLGRAAVRVVKRAGIAGGLDRKVAKRAVRDVGADEITRKRALVAGRRALRGRKDTFPVGSASPQVAPARRPPEMSMSPLKERRFSRLPRVSQAPMTAHRLARRAFPMTKRDSSPNQRHSLPDLVVHRPSLVVFRPNQHASSPSILQRSPLESLKVPVATTVRGGELSIARARRDMPPRQYPPHHVTERANKQGPRDTSALDWGGHFIVETRKRQKRRRWGRYYAALSSTP
jgi:hypothetical protein